MPEILPDHVPSPRTPLVWDGTRYRAVRGHTDGTLQVRGENQLHSYLTPLLSHRRAAISGADGYLQSLSPGAGEVWVVTRIVAFNETTATSGHRYYVDHDGAGHYYYEDIHAFGTWQQSQDSPWLHLDPNDFVRCYFAGGLVGDMCRITLFGHIMTLET